ncbi:hypothetical protein [Allobaculum sp. Allo2]|uniref:hypothetical protein n=1 Tax=Allobaculum sp. Allo2 TaxID=2853432 RepID=UPI001F60C5D8|nr:hypothetical protein [Allobaculum sp. Allo2]UNT92905.1 hypothetical protein KWG61_12695 [Allobaculum sp. Allo2]
MICGRSTDAQDIKEWITDGFLETTNLKKLWMTEELSEKGRSDDISVGIITFHNIYNHTFIHNNIGFLKEVQFVLLLEPSNLLGTGQIGLRNILEICESSGDPLTYCALDRSVDGLVDALSHLVHQPLVEVLAPPASEAGTCRAIWHVDGPGMQNRIVPGISRYLGVGTEIALEGLANGADEIYWFSSSKSPIADIRWNVSQYYPSFCEYTHTRLEQNQLEERMHYESHLWQVPEMEKGYLIVEDEFRNAFDIARLFSSRLEKKGFVNILSENYMLRDYMTANAEMMTVDSKAIPTIVPDYARTERNFIIRLLMLMSMEPVDESYISNQLAIHGIHSRKTYDVLQHLIHKHTGQEKFKIHTTQVNAYRADIQATRFQYSINLDQLHSVYDSALRSVYFVIENEKRRNIRWATGCSARFIRSCCLDSSFRGTAVTIRSFRFPMTAKLSFAVPEITSCGACITVSCATIRFPVSRCSQEKIISGIWSSVMALRILKSGPMAIWICLRPTILNTPRTFGSNRPMFAACIRRNFCRSRWKT